MRASWWPRIAVAVAVASVLLGLLLPVYTDEVGWRLQARMALDGGVDRWVAEGCGPNTLARPPLFIQPLRHAGAAINLALADPLFVRLAGVGWALVWLMMLARLIAQVARGAREAQAIRSIAFALAGFGVLPFLLVLSRPEQPVLLALTAAILVVTRRPPRTGRGAAVAAVAVVGCAVLAIGYHPKGVAYMPAFLACAAFSSCGRKARVARVAAIAAMVALSLIAARYWIDRFRCPADPILAAMLARENVALVLMGSDTLVGKVGALLMGGNPLNYVALSMPAKFTMSDWLPPRAIGNGGERAWGALLRAGWIVALAVSAGCLAHAMRAAWRARRLPAATAIALALTMVIVGWGMTQLNRNAYEASLALPAMILVAVLAVAGAGLPAVMVDRLRGLAAVLVVLAALNLAALMVLYAPPLWRAVRDPGYVAKQSFSISPYGFGTIERQIVAAGRMCGIDPARRQTGILVDDLTYFSYMASYRPLHRTTVLSVWNGTITDPVAYLRSKGSAGAVIGCRFLPWNLRSRAKKVGDFCCLGPLD